MFQQMILTLSIVFVRSLNPQDMQPFHKLINSELSPRKSRNGGKNRKKDWKRKVEKMNAVFCHVGDSFVFCTYNPTASTPCKTDEIQSNIFIGNILFCLSAALYLFYVSVCSP